MSGWTEPFWRLLPAVRRAERARAVFFTGLFTLISAAQTMGLAGSEALLLSELGAERLPEAFILASLVTVLGSLLYARRVGEARNDDLFVQMLGVAGVVLVAASVGAAAGVAWLLPALFCAFYLTQAVFINHFWTFSSDYFDTVTSKRLFPVLTIGCSVGGLIGGAAVAVVAPITGAASLIAGWGVLLVLAAVQLRAGRRPLRRWGPLDLEEADETSVEGMRGAVQFLTGSRLGAWLFASALGMVLALFIAQFLYSDIFVRRYPEPAALATFFGVYLAVTNLIEIALELAVTPWLIRRFGVPTSHLLHPLLTLGSFAGLAAGYGLTTGIVARMNRELVENAIAAPIRTLVYNALPLRFRGRIRAFLEGIVVYAGMSVAGALLLLFPGADPMVLCVAGGGAALLYGLANWQARSAYLQTLVTGIRAGRLDLSEIGDEIGGFEATRLADLCNQMLAVEQGLPSRSLRQIAPALARHGMVQPIVDGARHDSPEIRELCVQTLGDVSDVEVSGPLTAALEDPVASVRLAALDSLATRGTRDLAEHAARLSRDATPEVRARAISLAPSADAGLATMLASADRDEVVAALRHASPEDASAVASRLSDADPGIRAAAIEASARLADSASFPATALAAAVADGDVDVRHAAAEALGSAGDPGRAAALGPLLGDPIARVRSAAVAALGRHGDPAIAVASPYLRDERESAVVSALRALAATGIPEGHDLLVSELRHRARQLWFRVAALQKLPGDDDIAARFLRLAYADALMRSRRLAFEILALVENPRVIANVERALRFGTARARADALEVLSNLGDREAAAALVVLHEQGPLDERLASVASLLEVPSDVSALLEASMRSEVRWIRMAAEVLSGAGRTDASGVEVMESLLALKQVPLFANLTLEQLDAVHQLAVESFYLSEEEIVRQGDPGGQLYLLLEGSVDVILGRGTPDEACVNTIESVGYFGEMAVFDDAPRSATIVAREKSRLLALDGASLKELILQMPEVSFEILRVLSERVRAAERRQVEPARR
jgi:HEAT repeat protein